MAESFQRLRCTVSSEPNENVVNAIARKHCKSIARIDRFKSGLCHFVYEVVDARGERFVLRIARRGNESLLVGALYWHPRLVASGVPLARILGADTEGWEFGFAYLVLERLTGTDLEEVYSDLSHSAKHQLGTRMATIQESVAALESARSYGEAASYQAAGSASIWAAVVQSTLEVCRSRVGAGCALRVADLRGLDEAALALNAAFGKVPHTAFLDDTTTKNVIVTPNGALSGIVDVDTLWFGDPLYPLGLTRAAFARRGFDSIYTDAWAEAVHLDVEGQCRLRFYTALFAAVLLTEHGLRFNRDQPVRFTRDAFERLRMVVVSPTLP